MTAEELDTIKNSLVQTFPSSFASKAQSMAIFASDEYTKRDPAYWATYRDRIRAVTAADVQRVAREHLIPEKMIVLVVGKQAEIDLGDEKHPVTLEGARPRGQGHGAAAPRPDDDEGQVGPRRARTLLKEGRGPGE